MRLWCVRCVHRYRPEYWALIRLPLHTGSNGHSTNTFKPILFLLRSFRFVYSFSILLFSLWPQRDTRQPPSFPLCSLPMPFTSSFDAVVRLCERRTESRIAHNLRARVCEIFILRFRCAANEYVFFSFFLCFASCFVYFGQVNGPSEWTQREQNVIAHTLWPECARVCMCVCAIWIRTRNTYLLKRFGILLLRPRRCCLLFFRSETRIHRSSCFVHINLKYASLTRVGSDWISSECH